MLYGRTKFDHETGSMIFIKPRQLVELQNLEFEEDGYIMFVHENYLNGHDLYKDIQQYSFFDYETNEALHLSPKEEKIILNIFQTIEQEYDNSEDEFSREIILAGINSMLKYAKRFYKRQFINRKQHSGKITTEFNKVLQQYIHDGLLVTNGLPSVGYLADMLHVSSRYLTDLLKIETGKTAQELIHITLVNEAKYKLRTGDIAVSEVAYALGFENMSYFSRLFKKQTGVLPSAYKKNLLN
jgi:AraC-like DNA-binding protein